MEPVKIEIFRAHSLPICQLEIRRPSTDILTSGGKDYRVVQRISQVIEMIHRLQPLIAVVRDIGHHNGAIRWVRVAVDDHADLPGRGRIELAGVCVRDRFPREVHLRVADLGIVEIVGCEISYGSELFGNGNANGFKKKKN